MNDLVFQGATVDGALETAADTLGRPGDALRYVVLESGSEAKGRTPAVPARIVVLLDAPKAATDSAPRGFAGQLEAIGDQLSRALQHAITLSLDESGEGRTITVEAESTPAVWGPHGEVYRALEHVLKRAARADATAVPVRVVSPPYRAWRDAQIRDEALELARAVVVDGQARPFPGLNAYERRVVHLALEEQGGVATRSIGEGDQRQLLIEPRPPKS